MDYIYTHICVYVFVNVKSYINALTKTTIGSVCVGRGDGGGVCVVTLKQPIRGLLSFRRKGGAHPILIITLDTHVNISII